MPPKMSEPKADQPAVERDPELLAMQLEETQAQLGETRSMLERLQKQIEELGWRVGTPPPGQPRTDPGLDPEARVAEILARVESVARAADAELQAGPKQFDVYLVVGEKPVMATKRRVGGASDGDAIGKYKRWANIIREGAPTQVVAVEVAA